ncbi:hypothetical protein H4696_003337 [Amycolatopsis lexingtonensis]|uniref:Uncharacterized protein n=1 Tax=Amycolatopsis lexingtonensis TaxID=218822 RepID=A0ABR9HZX4_9PSEU|nr:hypothetical protein [Amycolatopsis lexingtonensis]MBE1496237.1 hypothetical protein [Amycolatopsis lexingtonensis]
MVLAATLTREADAIERNDQVAENSASGRFTGPVVQAATVHGGVHIGNAEPVRSYYLTRVESFAPRSLIGRDDELAELARFCTSPDTAGAYA